MMSLSQLLNEYWYIIKFHNLFRFPQFYPNVLFLFQDLNQNTTLHLEVISPQASADYNNSSDFLCFWKCWFKFQSTVKLFCGMSLIWYFSDVFLMIKLGLWVLGRKNTEIQYHSHHVISEVHKSTWHHSWCWPWSPGC